MKLRSPHPILICLPPQTEEVEDFGLPDDSDNIFQRLIRNPHVESDKPRERECTEMLCSVLRNSQPLRQHLLRWLGRLTGDVPSDFGDLDFQIETERSIGSKRDDLRIEGWRQVGEEQTIAVLWTVEVKVGAGFHLSSLQAESDGEEVVVDQSELVNQLLNYDSWLRVQPAECIAGFVLALDNMEANIPTGLSVPWKCITWTELGQQLQFALKDNDLPPLDDLLGKHLLGFIRRHLWRNLDMSDDRLSFDDLALIRAFSYIGVECDKKIIRLVDQLPAVLEASGIGCGKITQQNVLFRPSRRTVVYRPLLDEQVSGYPWLFMGVEQNHLTVYVETTVTSDLKREFHEAIASVATKLTERDPRWFVHSLEDRLGKDVEITLPLLDLLVTEDQDDAFMQFFAKALDDINEAGVIEALRTTIGLEDDESDHL